jgi:hypothetical protein
MAAGRTKCLHPITPASVPLPTRPRTPPPPSCVGLYALINGILSAFSYVRERDSFMVTQPKLVRRRRLRRARSQSF